MANYSSNHMKNCAIMEDFSSVSSEKNYQIVIDRRFVKAVGQLEPAVLLAFIITQDTVLGKYKTAGEAFSDPKWFLLRYDDITDAIGLSRKRIRRFMKMILDTGVVETKRMGCPARNHYRINRALWYQRFCS